MGRLPPFKRFAEEDFPSQKSWIGSFFGPLNGFFSVVRENLTNGLTFTENILSFIYTARVDQNYPLKFLNQMKVKPVGVLMIYIADNADPRPTITNSTTIDWSYDGESININNITGLTAAHTYTARFLVLGG
jgi:hypothetical protein